MSSPWQQLVDRERGLVAVRHRPDDVLRPEGGVAAEEHLGVGRAHGPGIDLGHAPLVELDADVALDPGKGVLLADRDQHVVAREMLVGLAGRHQVAAALGVVLGLHLLEQHAGQRAVLVGEFLRHEEIEDRDALVHGVLLLPGRRLHLLEAGAHDHLARPRRRAGATSGSSPSRCCRRRARSRACRSCRYGRTRPTTASRCRYGCWPPLPCGRECRDRGRAARRSRRRSRRSPRPAAPSGCRCACRRGIRRRDRGCSRTPRRSPIRAGGSAGSACGSCRRPWGPGRTRRSGSRAARDRARPSSEAGPPPTSAMRLPFLCAAGRGSRPRMSSL